MTDAPLTARSSVEVPVDPNKAFDLFTTDINRWWRRGTVYWNDRQRAVGLRFEPRTGGRFLEVYDAATGEGFEIGRILVWEPGHRLVYTWRESGWKQGEHTEVEVRFEPAGRNTRVTVTHSGWERVTDGQGLSRGYASGWNELLGWLVGAAPAGGAFRA